MKIKVVTERTGKIEEIEFSNVREVRTGKELDTLVCEDGKEYFFTKEGFYDGWGVDCLGREDLQDLLPEDLMARLEHEMRPKPDPDKPLKLPEQ